MRTSVQGIWTYPLPFLTSRPELEEERQQLVQQAADNSQALQDVEDNILNTLSSSEGNILEDESAIQILDSSKKISKEIIEKQAIAGSISKLIDKNRLAYRPIAKYTECPKRCHSYIENGITLIIISGTRASCSSVWLSYLTLTPCTNTPSLGLSVSSQVPLSIGTHK